MILYFNKKLSIKIIYATPFNNILYILLLFSFGGAQLEVLYLIYAFN